MSNKNFTLTYDELLLLLKDAYRNGYATYEMTAAGLERYDDDGYARWVLLGMEKNKQEELDNTDGTELPTPEMIDWYQKNTQYMDDWDELDRDVEMDRVRQDFFDTFEDELKGVDMFDVWNKLF